MANTDLAKREIAAFYRCDLNADGLRSGNRIVGRAVQPAPQVAALVPVNGRSANRAPVPFEDARKLSQYRQFSPCAQLGCGAVVEDHNLATDSRVVAPSPTAYLRRHTRRRRPPRCTTPAQGFHMMNWAARCPCRSMSAARVCLATRCVFWCRHQRASLSMQCSVAHRASPRLVGAEAMHGVREHGRVQWHARPGSLPMARSSCIRISSYGRTRKLQV